MGMDANADTATDPATSSETVRYGVYGMDCAHDAADVERVARGVPGVSRAAVSLTAQAMTLAVADVAALPSVERAVEGLGYRVARLAAGEDPAAAARAGLTPAYRRALAIVVALNLGYGVVEMAGGFLSGSQAVRADALDFLGDGLISLLGLVAFGWAAVWRARTALATPGRPNRASSCSIGGSATRRAGGTGRAGREMGLHVSLLLVMVRDHACAAGGPAPVLIEQDMYADDAARRIAHGKAFNAGQISKK